MHTYAVKVSSVAIQNIHQIYDLTSSTLPVGQTPPRDPYVCSTVLHKCIGTVHMRRSSQRQAYTRLFL